MEFEFSFAKQKSIFLITIKLISFFTLLLFPLDSIFALKSIDITNSPYGLKYNPMNEKMYYLDYFPYKIIILNNSSNVNEAQEGEQIPLPERPLDITYNPNDNKMYISLDRSHVSLYVLNGTNNVIDKIGGIPYPSTIAYNPSNNFLYISSETFSLYTLNTTSKEISKVTNLTKPVFGITYNPINENLYLTTGAKVNPDTRNLILDQGDNPILVVNSTSNNVIDTISINASSYLSAFNPINKLLYVTSSKGIFTINSTDNKIVENITNKELNNTQIFGIAYNPANRHMFVTFSENGEGFFAIDSHNNKISKKFFTSDDPLNIAYNPANRHMYVNGIHGNVIPLINESNVITGMIKCC